MRADAINGALAAGATAAGITGASMAVDTLTLIASIAGGLVGALITARDAFDEESVKPVWKVATAAATSLFLGASSGFFVAPLAAMLFNAQLTSDPRVMLGVTFVVALAGERVMGPLLKRFLGEAKP